jgi:hypothetical protein
MIMHCHLQHFLGLTGCHISLATKIFHVLFCGLEILAIWIFLAGFIAIIFSLVKKGDRRGNDKDAT